MGRRARGTSPNDDSIGSGSNSSNSRNKKWSKNGKKKTNSKHNNNNNDSLFLDDDDMLDTLSMIQYGFMLVMLITTALMLITFNLMQNTNSFGSAFPGSMVNQSPLNYNHGGGYHQQQQYHTASSALFEGTPGSSDGDSYYERAPPPPDFEDIPMHTTTHGNHNDVYDDDVLGDSIHEEPISTAMHYYPTDIHHRNQPISISPKPKLCSDGVSYGYSDWNSLRSAVHSLNEGRHNPYHEYEVMHNNAKRHTTPYETIHHHLTDSLPNHYGGVMTDSSNDEYHLEPPTPFTICPGITMKTRNRHGPIYINTEDTIIECDACILDIGGTHFSFGPYARGVVIRGITLMGAKKSSLTFHAHGADATFEDCTWIGNAGLNNKGGAVADLNSTSSVSFFRCEISDSKQSLGVMGGYGFNSVVGSSLTIRNWGSA